MPAKEREFIDWPSPPSLSSAPALPASPARSNSPSAGRTSTSSSVAAPWARAVARGWRAACWRHGASAPPPSPRSRPGARRRSPGGPSVSRARCSMAAWWSPSRAMRPISPASPTAPSASNGPPPNASPSWSPVSPDVFAARCSSLTRLISIPGGRWPPCRALAPAASRSASASRSHRRRWSDIVVDCRGSRRPRCAARSARVRVAR
jgi:hypothetical protein